MNSVGDSTVPDRRVVEHGRSQGEIILNDWSNHTILWWEREQTEIVEFSANELQRYLSMVHSPAPAVVPGGVTSVAQVGRSVHGLLILADKDAVENSLEQPVSSLMEWLQQENKLVAATGKDAFAVCRLADMTVLAGSNPRSVLYAAYALLEELGFRFFAPNFNFYQGTAEYIPNEAQLFSMAKCLNEEASFHYRRLYVEEGWSFNETNLLQLIDWMAKRRLNVLVYPYNYQNEGLTTYDTWRKALAPELERRGIAVEVGGHGYASWLSPEKYPHYYIPGYNVFDVANPEAVRTYVENVVDYLRERPEIRIFDAWPPDAAQWPPSVIEQFGSVADAEASVVNQLSAAVQSQLPGVQIERIAYIPATEPPSFNHMHNSANVVVDIAPYDRSYRVPIFDHSSEKNAYYDDLIQRWISVYSGSVAIYEYYRKYSWHSLPNSFLQLIGVEIPYYGAIGASGMGTYAEPADWITYEAMHYLTAELSWNTNLDTSGWSASYCAARFGPAAGDMQRYFQLVERAGATLYLDPAGNYDDRHCVSTVLQYYKEAQASLAAAAKLAPSESTFAWIINRLSWNLVFAIADTELSLYRVTGSPARQEEARQRVEKIIDTHRFDGIILQNCHTMHRCARGLTSDSWAHLYAMYRSPVYAVISSRCSVNISADQNGSIELTVQSSDYLPHMVRWHADPSDVLELTVAKGFLSVRPAIASAQSITVRPSSGTLAGSYPLTIRMTCDENTELPKVTMTVAVL